MATPRGAPRLRVRLVSAAAQRRATERLGRLHQQRVGDNAALVWGRTIDQLLCYTRRAYQCGGLLLAYNSNKLTQLCENDGKINAEILSSSHKPQLSKEIMALCVSSDTAL